MNKAEKIYINKLFASQFATNNNNKLNREIRNRSVVIYNKIVDHLSSLFCSYFVGSDGGGEKEKATSFDI